MGGSGVEIVIIEAHRRRPRRRGIVEGGLEAREMSRVGTLHFRKWGEEGGGQTPWRGHRWRVRGG